MFIVKLSRAEKQTMAPNSIRVLPGHRLPCDVIHTDAFYELTESGIGTGKRIMCRKVRVRCAAKLASSEDSGGKLRRVKLRTELPWKEPQVSDRTLRVRHDCWIASTTQGVLKRTRVGSQSRVAEVRGSLGGGIPPVGGLVSGSARNLPTICGQNSPRHLRRSNRSNRRQPIKHRSRRGGVRLTLHALSPLGPHNGARARQSELDSRNLVAVS